MQSTAVRSLAAFATPPHLRYGGAAAWFTAPAGAVLQLVEPTRGTVDLANWIVGPGYDELERRFPGRRSLIFVFDLGLMTGRTHAARSVFLGKAREVGSRFSEGFFVPPKAASPAYKQSMRAAIMLIRALGVEVHTVESAAKAVEMRGLRALP